MKTWVLILASAVLLTGCSGTMQWKRVAGSPPAWEGVEVGGKSCAEPDAGCAWYECGSAYCWFTGHD